MTALTTTAPETAPTALPEPLPAALLAHPVFSVAEVDRLGVPRRRVEEAVRRGELLRLRRGWFTHPPPAGPTGPAAARLLAARSLAASRAWGLPMTGRSALAVVGLPVPHADGVEVTLAGAPRQRRSGREVRIVSRLPLPGADDPGAGGGCVPLLEAVLVAALHNPLAGLVAADAAVRCGLLSPSEVLDGIGALDGRRGADPARRALRLVDGRRADVHESTLALLVGGWGLRLVPGVTLTGATGTVRVAGVVEGSDVALDLADPDPDLPPDGLDRDDAGWADDLRTDALRTAGYRRVRVTPRDLGDPASLRDRVEGALIR